jgi:hypothetical protein
LPSIRARQYSGRSAFPEALVSRWRGPGGGNGLTGTAATVRMPP